MKIMQRLAFTFIVIILIIRGIWPKFFVLDEFSIVLLFLLAIPLLSPYLKKVKWFGTEFVFKDEIKKLDVIVKKSEQQVRDAENQGKVYRSIFETFSTENASQLLDSDPNLSLASLRIEIEKVLLKAAKTLFSFAANRKLGNKFYISKLLEKGIISKEQSEALEAIVNMCNKAIHGAVLSREEAKEILLLTERLNKSFAIGYSINFESNDRYSRHDLLCEWEHCVEHFPPEEKLTQLSCPVFGHDCPGGLETRKSCARKLDDMPKKRFIKNTQ